VLNLTRIGSWPHHDRPAQEEKEDGCTQPNRVALHVSGTHAQSEGEVGYAKSVKFTRNSKA